MYRIQTDARVITGNTTEIKKPRPQAEVFYFEVGFPVITQALVCILYSYIYIYIYIYVVSSSPAARQFFFMYFPLTHSVSFFLYV